MSRMLAGIGLLFFLSTLAPERLEAYPKSERNRFQVSIIDYRKHVNRHFNKVRRRHTKHIIVHTSEGGLRNTLNVVTRGKTTRQGRRTLGGHAHYVIARDGRTYRTLDKQYRADHAGVSMWNGQQDISSISIGIELVGYHHTAITKAQYRSIGLLIEILQRIYGLEDKDVLTHSQVAYGGPNRWFSRSHRGRKRCAKNFIRSEAELGPTWRYDPDVRSGRLQADRELEDIYYGSRRTTKRQIAQISNVITRGNTAWMIAGEDYDSPDTIYRFPSGREITGNEVGRRVGWSRLPSGTQVIINEPEAEEIVEETGPVGTIGGSRTAWSYAGEKYRKKTTKYFFPNGRVQHGDEIQDWDGLPSKTRIIVDYEGPFRITASRPPSIVAGQNYQSSSVVYYFPDRRLKTGAEIKNWRRLPRGVQVFLPAKGS